MRLSVLLQRSLTAASSKMPEAAQSTLCQQRLGCERSYFHASTAAHGGRNGELAQVNNLGSSGASLLQGVDQSGQVGLQLFHAERGAANGGVNDASLVGTVLNLTSLGVLHGGGDIRRHGA